MADEQDAASKTEEATPQKLAKAREKGDVAKTPDLAMLASFGMALRYSLDMGDLADKLDQAIAAVLAKGLRTADIKSEGTISASTQQMGEAILKELQKLHA